MYAQHRTAEGSEFRLPLGRGTLKTLALYPHLQHVLNAGGLLLIDGLNASLHPLLVHGVIQIFLDPARNSLHAQLLFTSHDSWILNAEILRRNEIWTAEKHDGTSSLYSLAEFKLENKENVRKDAGYMKNYLLGRYGGSSRPGEFRPEPLTEPDVRLSTHPALRTVYLCML